MNFTDKKFLIGNSEIKNTNKNLNISTIKFIETSEELNKNLFNNQINDNLFKEINTNFYNNLQKNYNNNSYCKNDFISYKRNRFNSLEEVFPNFGKDTYCSSKMNHFEDNDIFKNFCSNLKYDFIEDENLDSLMFVSNSESSSNDLNCLKTKKNKLEKDLSLKIEIKVNIFLTNRISQIK